MGRSRTSDWWSVFDGKHRRRSKTCRRRRRRRRRRGRVVIAQFRRVLGGVALTLIVSSCGSVVATPQTTTTSTVAPPSEPPQWGVPTDQKPIFFYAADIPQSSRDRVEETFQKATRYWPNYGPLEVWVTGIQTMPIFNMVNEYCARRAELKQMNKFTCLDRQRDYTFEEYRKWSAIDAVDRDHRMQGQLSPTAEFGFHQYAQLSSILAQNYFLLNWSNLSSTQNQSSVKNN